MLTDKEIEDAANQLAAYRKSDALDSILANYEALLSDYSRLKSDFEEEREARERWKQQARGQERNPFVLVLVDADGYVFNDDLVAAGPEGGARAAQLLNDAIKASQRRKGLEHCETMVRVYANVAGLSKALAKAGLLGAEKRSLAPFIANFNRSYGLTDFVDAGEFKENADFKLREMLRLYAENAQCKHIYFAACHDSGYVSQLTAYRGHRDRFTLIRTSGLLFHDEFTKLGLGIEDIPGVFRSTGSLMDALYPKPLQSVAKPIAPSSPARAQSSESRDVCAFYSAGRCKYGEACKNLHLGPTTTTLPLRSSKLARSSWRNGSDPYDTSESPLSAKPYGASNRSFLQHNDLVGQLPMKEDIPDGHVAINANQQRLDAYLPVPTVESENRIKQKSASQRLCNAKHLTGYCPNSNCEYDHGHLDEDLIPTLEWLARSLPCPRREKCRNAACTAGHICQKPDCKARGGKGFCRFPWSMHVDDLEVDRYVPSVPAVSNRHAGSVSEKSLAASPPSRSDTYDCEEDEEDEDISSPNGGMLVSVS